MRWGRIHNLSGSIDEESIYRNIEDSLLPMSFLHKFNSCADIGSGAGFPALILACKYPDRRFYLIEPRGKRYSFLNNAVLEMKLKNVSIIKDYSYNVKDIKVDLITSRAVSEANSLIKQSRHLLNPGGRYLLFKGSDSERELDLATDFDVEIFKYEKRSFIYAKMLHNT